jgi:hypothetical protein
LHKLAVVKRLKTDIPEPFVYRSRLDENFDPRLNPFDNIFTFIFCLEFGFQLNLDASLYDDEEAYFKHNMVLSIEDGVLLYEVQDSSGSFALKFPTSGNRVHEDKWIAADDENLPEHFKHFLNGYYGSLNSATLLEPDLAFYLTDDLHIRSS